MSAVMDTIEELALDESETHPAWSSIDQQSMTMVTWTCRGMVMSTYAGYSCVRQMDTRHRGRCCGKRMNIFYLDRDPVIAAQMMCDKHVVKMILESAQMLSTAHRVLDGDEYADRRGLYKLAHKNHPSTIWVRSSLENYTWLYDHMVALMEEYTYRYGKHHATERLLAPLFKSPKNMDFETFFMTHLNVCPKLQR